MTRATLTYRPATIVPALLLALDTHGADGVVAVSVTTGGRDGEPVSVVAYSPNDGIAVDAADTLAAALDGKAAPVVVRGRPYVLRVAATYGAGLGLGSPLSPYEGRRGDDDAWQAWQAPASWRTYVGGDHADVARHDGDRAAWYRNDAPNGARRAILAALGDALGGALADGRIWRLALATRAARAADTLADAVDALDALSAMVVAARTDDALAAVALDALDSGLDAPRVPPAVDRGGLDAWRRRVDDAERQADAVGRRVAALRVDGLA